MWPYAPRRGCRQLELQWQELARVSELLRASGFVLPEQSETVGASQRHCPGEGAFRDAELTRLEAHLGEKVVYAQVRD